MRCSLGLGRRDKKCVIKDVVPGGNGERAGFLVSKPRAFGHLFVEALVYTTVEKPMHCSSQFTFAAQFAMSARRVALRIHDVYRKVTLSCE